LFVLAAIVFSAFHQLAYCFCTGFFCSQVINMSHVAQATWPVAMQRFYYRLPRSQKFVCPTRIHPKLCAASFSLRL